MTFRTIIESLDMGLQMFVFVFFFAPEITLYLQKKFYFSRDLGEWVLGLFMFTDKITDFICIEKQKPYRAIRESHFVGKQNTQKYNKHKHKW